jgi:hypothetical protein
MQRCTVTVRLSGDLNNTVRKSNVSPAEIVILREIHGGVDAVVDIQPNGMDKMPHRQERDRLEVIYGGPLVEKIFPGKFAPLPVSLKDIDVDAEEPAADLPGAGEEAGAATQAPEPGTQEPAPQDDGLTGDDEALIERVKHAKTRAELREIATDNEVDLDDVSDRMDDMRTAILTALFPDQKL